MNENKKQKIKKLIMNAGRHVLLCGVMILCWWGMFMPRLLMNEDTVKVVVADENFEYNIEDYDMYYDMYMEILQADEDKVVFKSKFLEYLKEAGILE